MSTAPEYYIPTPTQIGDYLSTQLVGDKLYSKAIANLFADYYNSLYGLGVDRVANIPVIDGNGASLGTKPVQNEFTVDNATSTTDGWNPRLVLRSDPFFTLGTGSGTLTGQVRVSNLRGTKTIDNMVLNNAPSTIATSSLTTTAVSGAVVGDFYEAIGSISTATTSLQSSEYTVKSIPVTVTSGNELGSDISSAITALQSLIQGELGTGGSATLDYIAYNVNGGNINKVLAVLTATNDDTTGNRVYLVYIPITVGGTAAVDVSSVYTGAPAAFVNEVEFTQGSNTTAYTLGATFEDLGEVTTFNVGSDIDLSAALPSANVIPMDGAAHTSNVDLTFTWKSTSTNTSYSVMDGDAVWPGRLYKVTAATPGFTFDFGSTFNTNQTWDDVIAAMDAAFKTLFNSAVTWGANMNLDFGGSPTGVIGDTAASDQDFAVRRNSNNVVDDVSRIDTGETPDPAQYVIDYTAGTEGFSSVLVAGQRVVTITMPRGPYTATNLVTFLTGTTGGYTSSQVVLVSAGTAYMDDVASELDPGNQLLVTSDAIPAGTYYNTREGDITPCIFNYAVVVWLIFGGNYNAASVTDASVYFTDIVRSGNPGFNGLEFSQSIPCLFPRKFTRCRSFLQDYVDALGRANDILSGRYYRYPAAEGDVQDAAYIDLIDNIRDVNDLAGNECQFQSLTTNVYCALIDMITEVVKWDLITGAQCCFKRGCVPLVEGAWKQMTNTVGNVSEWISNIEQALCESCDTGDNSYAILVESYVPPTIGAAADNFALYNQYAELFARGAYQARRKFGGRC